MTATAYSEIVAQLKEARSSDRAYFGTTLTVLPNGDVVKPHPASVTEFARSQGALIASVSEELLAYNGARKICEALEALRLR